MQPSAPSDVAAETAAEAVTVAGAECEEVSAVGRISDETAVAEAPWGRQSGAARGGGGGPPTVAGASGHPPAMTAGP